MILEESISVGEARGLGAKFVLTTLCCLVVAAMATTATATDFQSLAEQGYRWVLVNGPYATPNKADAAKLANTESAASNIELQDKTHAYFILPGMIVLVLENDSSTGLSRIRASGIVVDLWTETRYLSKQPMKDSYGVTETPESSGLGPLASPSPSPSPSASPLLDASPSPSASQTPTAAPVLQPHAHHHPKGQG
jgi:hypothetical protein